MPATAAAAFRDAQTLPLPDPTAPAPVLGDPVARTAAMLAREIADLTLWISESDDPEERADLARDRDRAEDALASLRAAFF